ncbi:uncharacterized protein LOC104652604 [Saimiri boliviensis]|uniref:uncharacterized protein LOC104652604 n=1 Tax=Saimiri boliviensis TaxID=27679 RepID=UPI003D786B1E
MPGARVSSDTFLPRQSGLLGDGAHRRGARSLRTECSAQVTSQRGDEQKLQGAWGRWTELQEPDAQPPRSRGRGAEGLAVGSAANPRFDRKGYFHSRTTEAGRRPQAGARRQEGSVHRPRAAVQNVPSSAAAPASRGPGVSASLMGVGFFPAWDTPEPPFCARSGQRPGATSTARLSGAWRQPAAAFPSPGGAEPPASPTGHGPRAFDPRPRQQDRPCHCGRENVADAPRGAQASPARNRHGSRQRRRRWEPRWNRCAEHGGPRTPVTTTSPQSPG